MKKTKLLLLVFAVLLVLGACSGTVTKKQETEYVSSLIENIGTVGYTSLQSLNRAEHAYASLTDEQKKDVENHNKLSDARKAYDELTSVPKKGRIDREKFQIGAYCYRESLWNDTDMQKFADAGCSLITGAPYNKTLLDLCQKYGVGTFVHSLYYSADRTIEVIDEKFATYEDHPAIWGMDLIDEPHASQLPGIGKVVERAEAIFPASLCYINLFPNYADSGQLGNRSYEEHIAAYVENVGTDYISYDHYMYSNTGGLFYSNLQIVADACRQTGRDVWIVLEVSNLKELLNDRHMRAQAYSSMCYGTRLISWACWTYGWYKPDLQIVDSQNNYTSMYEDLKSVNHEILKVSEDYMKFENIATFTLGGTSQEALAPTALAAYSWEGQDVFSLLSIDGDGSAVVGYFEKKDGSEYALLVSNTSDIKGGEFDNTFTFAVPYATSVSAYIKGEKTELTAGEDGMYSVVIPNCGGTFIMVERDEAAAFHAEVKEHYKDYSKNTALEITSDTIGFGADATGFEYDVKGISELGLEFVLGRAASAHVADLAAKNIGIYANDIYHKDRQDLKVGITIPHALKYGYHIEFLQKLGENPGLVISQNEFNDIEPLINATQKDFFVMHDECIRYSGDVKLMNAKYFGALATAGKFCVEKDKSLWIMLDTAANPAVSGAAPTPSQLTWQIWSAYTFGAKKVIFQSYEALKNNDELYETAKTAISDIKALAPIYTEYEYSGIYTKGIDARSPKVSLKDAKAMERVPYLKNIDADDAALFGLFKSENGSAMMLLPANTKELLEDALSPLTVTITLDGTEKTVTAYVDGKATVLSSTNGTYTVSLQGYKGVFVTVE